jgi:hypothetical protein
MRSLRRPPRSPTECHRRDDPVVAQTRTRTLRPEPACHKPEPAHCSEACRCRRGSLDPELGKRGRTSLDERRDRCLAGQVEVYEFWLRDRDESRGPEGPQDSPSTLTPCRLRGGRQTVALDRGRSLPSRSNRSCRLRTTLGYEGGDRECNSCKRERQVSNLRHRHRLQRRCHCALECEEDHWLGSADADLARDGEALTPARARRFTDRGARTTRHTTTHASRVLGSSGEAADERIARLVTRSAAGRADHVSESTKAIRLDSLDPVTVRRSSGPRR